MASKDNPKKLKKLFVPFAFFRLNYFESLLSEMESRGYVLRCVCFGCLLYFDCCKPRKNVLYYLTQTVKHLGNEEELNRKSLVNERNGRVRSRSEFASLKLCGF